MPAASTSAAPSQVFSTPTSSSQPTLQTLFLTKHTGNIFAAPDYTVLIYSCNTKGKWGAGITVPFKTAYLEAFNAYREHCISNAAAVLMGTCLLIAPAEIVTGPKHWIACLFTSKEYGLKKDGPDDILKNTELAVRDLLVKLRQAEERGDMVGTLRMCKINSGKFGVPWERTEAILEGIRLDGEIKIEIWDR
jgi:ADP-ribose 1''-phosphate phosphatase